MKKFVIVAALLAGMAMSFAQTNAPVNANPPQSKIAETLQSLERQWADAVMRADVKTIDSIQADDFEFTDPTGQLWTKARALDFIKAGRLQIDFYVMSDFKVRVYGNAAVVNFRVSWNGKSDGADISGPQRMTDVFVLKDGKWRCVSSHACIISTPPAKKN